jgi:hypothetical protein
MGRWFEHEEEILGSVTAGLYCPVEQLSATQGAFCMIESIFPVWRER